ncbi:alpha/beta hydrolase [Aquimarina mytili]|uniref:Alpha/beta hydrolase n=1 Tax=Aquimarina mytili TaxID=874423 RepID=A0A936ZYS8_9FLAO|nr:alpha/beta hydrolase-fold protein [Aquimarina mytili]MBL0684443.1 alpha/beta hydrolase [Aquimarina mytili]
MKLLKSTILILLLASTSCKQQSKEDQASTIATTEKEVFNESKVILHKNFKSKYVDARNVEVFLPTGYDKNASQEYNVLYMHDGQNVFNPETSYTGIDWGVDEAVDSLIRLDNIEKTIVVAAWNNGSKRFPEYMPKSPSEASETIEAKKGLKEYAGVEQLYSDEYLKFLVEELKPFIENTYNVSTKREDTSIMGSSMGGLISLYAICKYPKVFGAAGCISTHWPVPILGELYIKTLPASLPDPATHKIYFDYGTETLDAQYEPYQKQVDQIMKEKGYTEGENWITKKFEGAEHNEKSWKARIHTPLEFLLKF